MPLAPGTHLGPYEITAPLGAGGMGEVYRARDSRLERSVAIKILPEQLSKDPTRKQRFEREAKTISSLNHPHICTLHDIGSQDGIDYLVMECVEGETLAKRLEKGALSLEQVLKYGAQVADALDRAHRAGIVHRDLKPGNIMLTAAGAKLLDFGLAKSIAAASLATMTATKVASPVTQEGTIVGTFQYMSPEQVEGRELDGRSDIFSLGAVLYEMVTGKRAFEGKAQLSVASAILEKEPEPISAVKPMTPAALDHAIRQCLAKDPEERWQTGRDLASELQWIASGDSTASPKLVTLRKYQALRWGLIGAAVGMTTIGILGLVTHRWKREGNKGVPAHFALTPPDQGGFEPSLALSPDGSQLAFVVNTKGKSQIWVRPLSTLDAHPIPGTEGGTGPFWSPDGHYLGFFADQKLKKVDVARGSSQILCDAFDPRGATWNRDGVIVFSPRAATSLYKISAEGGAPEPVSILEAPTEVSHRWPQFLPDGRHLLYVGYRPGVKTMTAWFGSLDSKSKKRVIDTGSMVTYVEPGYLLSVREHSLVAQAFDSKRGELQGPPFILAEDVDAEGEGGLTGRASFSANSNGTLAFLQGVTPKSQLTWYDRKGVALQSLGAPAYYQEPAFSPDGKSLVFSRTTGGGRGLWIRDMMRGTESRFTFDVIPNTVSPVWTPDGRHVLFAADTAGHLDLYSKASDGTGKEELLLGSASDKFADDVSPDGHYLLYEQYSENLGWSELWMLPLTGERKPRPYLQGEAHLTHAAFSPNGRWLAYQSNETAGHAEIFVQSFPEVGSKFQVSNGGGDNPVWRSDGKELVYFGTNSTIIAMAVETGATFRAGASQLLFQVPPPDTSNAPRSVFVLDRDGQRILVNRGVSDSSRKEITVLTNWEAELTKK